MSVNIDNREDALTLALVLAVTAETNNQAMEATKLAEFLAKGMDQKKVDICKMAAEVVLDIQMAN